jgi:Hemerythrin HHE cation binding domain
LSVHAQIEEEIFYPALREALDESDLLDEAEVEHASVKSLIKQIMSSTPDTPLYDAKVMVLSEYVEHHVKEEEGEIFKKARKAKVNVDDLGMKLSARKSELMEAEASGKQSNSKPRASGASHKKTTEHA